MTHKLSTEDFRAVRMVLDAEDFALGPEGPEPPPSDLVDEQTWHAVMDLPDDVAIRTSNERGGAMRLLNHLLNAWTEAMPLRDGDPTLLATAMLDAYEALDASLFNMVHGFYKQSIGSLRDALEIMSLSCACMLGEDSSAWASWEAGDELRFKELCDRLQRPLRSHELASHDVSGATLCTRDKAWMRDLYRRLSRFAHARSDSLNGRIWESTGPIFTNAGFQLASEAFLETHALALILARIAGGGVVPLTARAHDAFLNVKSYIAPPFDGVCISYATRLSDKAP